MFFATVFATAAIVSLSTAETSFRSVDFHAGRYAAYVSIFTLAAAILVCSLAPFFAWMVGIPLWSTIGFFGFYLQRRARLFVPAPLAIVWYVSMASIPFVFLTASIAVWIDSGPHQEEVDPFFVQRVTQGVLFGYCSYVPFISVIFFGWTWRAIKRQMAVHIIPLLATDDLSDARSEPPHGR